MIPNKHDTDKHVNLRSVIICEFQGTKVFFQKVLNQIGQKNVIDKVRYISIDIFDKRPFIGEEITTTFNEKEKAKY